MDIVIMILIMSYVVGAVMLVIVIGGAVRAITNSMKQAIKLDRERDALAKKEIDRILEKVYKEKISEQVYKQMKERYGK